MQPYVPPHNHEAEEIVLGACLLREDCLIKVTSQLRSEDFYYPQHKFIYNIMLKLQKEKKAVDLTTVLLQIQHTEQKSYQEKLAQLALSIGYAYNLDAYCQDIKEKSFRRRILGILIEAQENILDTTMNSQSIIQEHLENCLALTKQFENEDKGLEHITEIIPQTVERIEQLNNEEDDSSLLTGFYDFDKLTGGLKKGLVTVIAGRSGHGKSSVAIEILTNLAKAGKTVGLFSLEMTSDQVVTKIMARINADVNPNVKITVDNLMQPMGLKHVKDFTWLAPTLDSMSEFDFWINDNSASSPAYIRRTLTAMATHHKMPDVIAIDYVGIMGIDDKHSNRAFELDKTIKDLRAMAKDFNVSFILLAQINRSVETRQDKRPGLADIRESGGFEQEAALVISVYNPIMYNPDADKVLELGILKNRFGATGKCVVGFEPSRNRIYNLL